MQASRGRTGSNTSQSTNGCCINSTTVEQLSRWEQHRPCSSSQSSRKGSISHGRSRRRLGQGAENVSGPYLRAPGGRASVRRPAEVNSSRQEEERRPEAGSQQHKESKQQQRQGLGRHVVNCERKATHPEKTVRRRTQAPLKETAREGQGKFSSGGVSGCLE